MPMLYARLLKQLYVDYIYHLFQKTLSLILSLFSILLSKLLLFVLTYFSDCNKIKVMPI